MDIRLMFACSTTMEMKLWMMTNRAKVELDEN
jgi:hypothetical protein